MLAESIELMHELWQNSADGEYTSAHGEYFTVENARIYTLPPEPPPIYLAAGGPEAAELAGEIADGLISTSPQKETVDTFQQAGGRGKPVYGQVTVCWAAREEAAVYTAHKIWPNAALKGPLNTELSIPEHFQGAAQMVKPEDVAKEIVCGPDPQRHIEMIQQFVDAGFDHVYVHQVGPDQEGFFRFYEKDILPHFAEAAQPHTKAA